MRNVIWFAALLVAALLAKPASAQSFGIAAQSARRTNNSIGLWGTSSALSSSFNLTSLFGSFKTVLLPGGTHVNQSRLSPADPNYMSAFGFKKLY